MLLNLFNVISNFYYIQYKSHLKFALPKSSESEAHLLSQVLTSSSLLEKHLQDFHSILLIPINL